MDFNISDLEKLKKVAHGKSAFRPSVRARGAAPRGQPKADAPSQADARARQEPIKAVNEDASVDAQKQPSSLPRLEANDKTVVDSHFILSTALPDVGVGISPEIGVNTTRDGGDELVGNGNETHPSQRGSAQAAGRDTTVEISNLAPMAQKFMPGAARHLPRSTEAGVEMPSVTSPSGLQEPQENGSVPQRAMGSGIPSRQGQTISKRSEPLATTGELSAQAIQSSGGKISLEKSAGSGSFQDTLNLAPKPRKFAPGAVRAPQRPARVPTSQQHAVSQSVTDAREKQPEAIGQKSSQLQPVEVSREDRSLAADTSRHEKHVEGNEAARKAHPIHYTDAPATKATPLGRTVSSGIEGPSTASKNQPSGSQSGDKSSQLPPTRQRSEHSEVPQQQECQLLQEQQKEQDQTGRPFASPKPSNPAHPNQAAATRLAININHEEQQLADLLPGSSSQPAAQRQPPPLQQLSQTDTGGQPNAQQTRLDQGQLFSHQPEYGSSSVLTEIPGGADAVLIDDVDTDGLGTDDELELRQRKAESVARQLPPLLSEIRSLLEQVQAAKSDEEKRTAEYKLLQANLRFYALKEKAAALASSLSTWGTQGRQEAEISAPNAHGVPGDSRKPARRARGEGPKTDKINQQRPKQASVKASKAPLGENEGGSAEQEALGEVGGNQRRSHRNKNAVRYRAEKGEEDEEPVEETSSGSCLESEQDGTESEEYIGSRRGTRRGAADARTRKNLQGRGGASNGELKGDGLKGKAQKGQAGGGSGDPGTRRPRTVAGLRRRKLGMKDGEQTIAGLQGAGLEDAVREMERDHKEEGQELEEEEEGGEGTEGVGQALVVANQGNQGRKRQRKRHLNSENGGEKSKKLRLPSVGKRTKHSDARHHYRKQLLRDLMLCSDEQVADALAGLPAQLKERVSALRSQAALVIQALEAGGHRVRKESRGDMIEKLSNCSEADLEHEALVSETGARRSGEEQEEASQKDGDGAGMELALPCALSSQIGKVLAECTLRDIKGALAVRAYQRLPAVEPDCPIDLNTWSLKRIIAHTQAWDRMHYMKSKAAQQEARKARQEALQLAGGERIEEGTAGQEERAAGPQVQVGEDGRIILNAETLTVPAQQVDVTSYRRVEEGADRAVNSHTYMRQAPRERWSEHETQLFYRALKVFGTDFTFIAHLFPNRDRRNIKNKFTREERENARMVNEALMRRSTNMDEKRALMDLVKSRVLGDRQKEQEAMALENSQPVMMIEGAQAAPKPAAPLGQQEAQPPQEVAPCESQQVVKERAEVTADEQPNNEEALVEEEEDEYVY